VGAALLASHRGAADIGEEITSSDDALGELVNDLAASSAPLALVLDDFHVITHPHIHDGLRFLLDNLPPNVRLILATRSDPPWPLARWRARGELIELHADDLRLTPEEAAAFLNDVMGLRLAADQIASLEARTEGWIAGLQMAALSMRGRDDTASFIRAFSGSHRHVLDYLVEEVLDRQPPAIQEFLLRTSILERLCGPLCDAVLRINESANQRINESAGRRMGESVSSPFAGSQAMLAYLDRANLFLVPLDDERRWYRYHRLFAELLQARLAQLHPDELPLLRCRACEWLEANGYSAEAIAHALAAADYERAANLIERHAQEVLWRGEAPLFRSWLTRLPEAIIRPRALLCLGNAQMQLTPDAVESWLQAAEAVMDTGLPAILPADTPAPLMRERIEAAIRSTRLQLARWRGDPPDKLLELVQAALDATPVSDRLGRASLYIQLGSLHQQLGREEAAEAALLDAETLSCDTHVALAMAALYARANIAMNHGLLRKTAAIFREALRTTVKPAEAAGKRIPALGPVYVGLGKVLLEFNELAEADACLTRGLELIAATADQSILVSACIGISRLRCAQRDFAAAHLALDRAEPACTWNPTLIPTLRAHAWLAQAAWEPAVLADALRWADAQELAKTPRLSPIMHGLARARIFQRRAAGAPDLGPILAALDEGIARAGVEAQLAWKVDLVALKALAHQVEGRDTEALAALEQTLAAGEPEGYGRTFLQHGQPMAELLRRAMRARSPHADYAARLLADLERELRTTDDQRPMTAAASSPTGAVPKGGFAPAAGTTWTSALVEPLSERELEVLRLLDSPLSSTEIAAQLFISANTVRSHIKNIYGKLGAHDRVEAVVRAREMGLL
jgi:LuxR family maltose regulon positive regulatory protein